MNNFYIHIEEQYWVFKCNNCPIIPMDDCVTGTYTIYQPIERLPPTAAKPTTIQNSAAIIAEIQVHATTLYHCIFYDCTLHSTHFMVKIIFFNLKIDWVNLTNERFDPMLKNGHTYFINHVLLCCEHQATLKHVWSFSIIMYKRINRITSSIKPYFNEYTCSGWSINY